MHPLACAVRHSTGPSKCLSLDRWLWAARFFKTRSLAKAAIEGCKVELAGNKPKPSEDFEIGQQLVVRVGGYERKLTITGLAEKHGSATIAQPLYEESPQSIEALRAEQCMRADLVCYRQRAAGFLAKLAEQGQTTVLVTNAHRLSLEVARDTPVDGCSGFCLSR